MFGLPQSLHQTAGCVFDGRKMPGLLCGVDSKLVSIQTQAMEGGIYNTWWKNIVRVTQDLALSMNIVHVTQDLALSMNIVHVTQDLALSMNIVRVTPKSV